MAALRGALKEAASGNLLPVASGMKSSALPQDDQKRPARHVRRAPPPRPGGGSGSASQGRSQARPEATTHVRKRRNEREFSRQDGERSAPRRRTVRRHRVAAGISGAFGRARAHHVRPSARSSAASGAHPTAKPSRCWRRLSASPSSNARASKRLPSVPAAGRRRAPTGRHSAHNLPGRLTSFVGRENEMAQIDLCCKRTGS